MPPKPTNGEMNMFLKEDVHVPRTFPIRRYQHRILRDLDFPTVEDTLNDGPRPGCKPSALLPYFKMTSRYCTTAVLEESVIDNERLKQTTFLKAFDQRFVEELLAVDGSTRAIVYSPDMEIARQGETADSLVVVVKGTVDLTISGVHHRRLSEGDYFGECEFLGASNARPVTATAVTFCDIRLLYRQALHRMLDRCTRMKDELPFIYSVWQRRPEKDALRLTKAFIDRCVNCLDNPSEELEQQTSSIMESSMRGSDSLHSSTMSDSRFARAPLTYSHSHGRRFESFSHQRQSRLSRRIGSR